MELTQINPNSAQDTPPMAPTSTLDSIKSFLAGKPAQGNQNAPETPPRPEIEHLKEDAANIISILEADEAAYQTGLQTEDQARIATASTVPDGLADAQNTLNSKGYTVKVDTVTIHNVTVSKPSSDHTASFTAQITGNPTPDDGDALVRRAALELQ